MSQITWDEWQDTFKPIKNPNSRDPGFWGHMFETFGEDLDYIKSANLPSGHYWTMVDGEGIHLDLVSGAQWVDRLGYFITEVPWDEDTYVTNQKG